MHTETQKRPSLAQIRPLVMVYIICGLPQSIMMALVEVWTIHGANTGGAASPFSGPVFVLQLLILEWWMFHLNILYVGFVGFCL